VYIQTLKRRIEAAEAQYNAAKNRGETETYLAVARFELDQLKETLAREEKRGAA
jgi:hypothetical protein